MYSGRCLSCWLWRHQGRGTGPLLSAVKNGPPGETEPSGHCRQEGVVVVISPVARSVVMVHHQPHVRLKYLPRRHTGRWKEHQRQQQQQWQRQHKQQQQQQQQQQRRQQQQQQQQRRQQQQQQRQHKQQHGSLHFGACVQSRFVLVCSEF
uniref:Uncharacterized protein n=1 Tax=Tetradesmus obliquus TaxID=3088 RepID=A0A383W4V2_TETOB|eukprot:jgi/Sobl393_1/20075/SZX71696.1